MKRSIKILLAVNVVIATVLAFAYPHLMIAPGPVVEGHAKVAEDCFACHTVFFGASSPKCVACHTVADIGIKTTEGKAIVRAKKPSVAFHQGLLETDCVACHTDHVGVSIYRIRQHFSHDLLDLEAKDRCVACHAKPQDKVHRSAPTDCKACHTTKDWKGAKLDHSRFFVFDKNHKRCKMCHRTEDYKQYTCFSCHAHDEDEVRRSHRREGIRDIDNCVKCHRSADEDEAERAWESIKRGIPYTFPRR